MQEEKHEKKRAIHSKFSHSVEYLQGRRTWLDMVDGSKNFQTNEQKRYYFE